MYHILIPLHLCFNWLVKLTSVFTGQGLGPRLLRIGSRSIKKPITVEAVKCDHFGAYEKG